MAGRKRNESRFSQWDELPNGGRVKGYARYVKEVDADEKTVLIVQEIYDAEGRLIALHQKFPQDTGHVELSESEDDF
ncbi:MAG: hypothetical protein IAE80_08465 [Anaerolinea sp.]|nr:hypothetical protein [Anaerolinea sp.]